jgi:hypothetical protein
MAYKLIEIFGKINSSNDLEETVIDGWGVNKNIEMVDRVAFCANKLQRWGKRKKGKV